ncbi:MAG: DNA replication and repair protein RecF, partial [Bacteroidota bacterium]
MELRQLELVNFKNYREQRVRFSGGINVIYGNNGSGKTNLLDAIYVLSFGKSYFSIADRALVQDHQPYYRLQGDYHSDDRQFQLTFKYQQESRRQITLNGKKLKQVNDLIGRFPLVMVAPDDISVVYGGSKERRQFFDRILCQSDPEYLGSLLQYNRVLRHKDALLKSDVPVDAITIEAANRQLVPLAELLLQRRLEGMERIKPLILDHYRDISGEAENIAIEYQSDLREVGMAEAFGKMIQAEIRARRTLVGVQRDDYIFSISEKPLKKFGSQGQIKSFLYSLRMGEYYFLATSLHRNPILLLDDYFE